MTEQKHKQIGFAPLKSKKNTAVFDQADPGSDGDLLLLREAMKHSDIAVRTAGDFSEMRHSSSVRHQMRGLIA